MNTESGESDEELMRRVRSGDRLAFSALVMRHQDRFFRAAWRLLSDTGEAEDVVQEAFLKLWRSPASFDPARGARFTTWFYRVVINLAHDRGRRKRFTVPESRLAPGRMESVFDEGASPEQELAARQYEDLLERAVQSLPERQKTALNLCFYEGVGNGEAAEIMGVSVKALESLLIRAKRGMRDWLEAGGLLGEENSDGVEDHERRPKRKIG